MTGGRGEDAGVHLQVQMCALPHEHFILGTYAAALAAYVCWLFICWCRQGRQRCASEALRGLSRSEGWCVRRPVPSPCVQSLGCIVRAKTSANACV